MAMRLTTEAGWADWHSLPLSRFGAGRSGRRSQGCHKAECLAERAKRAEPVMEDWSIPASVAEW